MNVTYRGFVVGISGLTLNSEKPVEGIYCDTYANLKRFDKILK